MLNLEGLWTRYEDPDSLLEEIAQLDDDKATRRMQEIYQEPIVPELVTERIRQIRDAAVVAAASVTPSGRAAPAGHRRRRARRARHPGDRRVRRARVQEP